MSVSYIVELYSTIKKAGHISSNACYFYYIAHYCGTEFRDEGKPVYDALLSKDDLINDHPREGNFQKALRAMMPLWSDDLCKVQEAMDVDSQ